MGQLECSSNIPVEKLDKKPTNSCSLFKNDENFHSFFKTVFSSKRLYRYKESSFDRPAKIFVAQLLEMIQKKVHKSCTNFSKIFSSKSSHGDVESSMKAPLIFFGNQPNFSRSIVKKHWFASFLKEFHPKNSIETENPLFDNSATFFARFGQNYRSESKKEKKNRNKAVNW